VSLSRACLLTIVALASASANVSAAVGPQKILTVDAEYLESTMPLYAAVDKQAAELKKDADGERRSDIELARQIRVSDILTALPDVISEVAAAQQADLVLDRAVAKRIAVKVDADITADIERRLKSQFGGRALELDP
jgi:Skp family chaperone for outer membrane proteins